MLKALRGVVRQRQQLGYTLQQLRFAQASAPAAPSLDWDALDELVTSEEGKRELGALRTAYFNLQDQSAEGTQKIKIDWDQYKNDVEPETLQLFKSALAGLDIPTYDSTEDVKKAKASFEPLFQQVDELAASSAKRVKEIEAELAAIKKEKEALSKITIHEELARNPEIAKQIDKEISEGNFLP